MLEVLLVLKLIHLSPMLEVRHIGPSTKIVVVVVMPTPFVKDFGIVSIAI